jgi:hypothetical protein
MVDRIFPYAEPFRLASAGLREGASALFQAEVEEGDTGREGKAYAGQVIAEAFTQLKVSARRFMTLPETGPVPQLSQASVLAHPDFKAAVMAVADALPKVEEFISVPASRIAATLRSWVEDGDTSQASIIAISSEAATKIAKLKGSRA